MMVSQTGLNASQEGKKTDAEWLTDFETPPGELVQHKPKGDPPLTKNFVEA